jgi:hypothetical protein
MRCACVMRHSRRRRRRGGTLCQTYRSEPGSARPRGGTTRIALGGFVALVAGVC